MAKFSNLRSFYAAVLVDIVEHHLLLLDGGKPGLADVFGLLSGLLIQAGAEG